MNEHVTGSGRSPAASRGYESRDVSVGRLALYGLALAATTAAFFLFSWQVFTHLAARESGRTEPKSPLIEAVGRRLPPSPRLEPDLSGRLSDLHRHEREVLGTYAWVDREQGVIRIPVERAMGLLVERLAGTGKQAPPRGSDREERDE